MEEYNWVNILPVLVGGCLSVRQQHMTNISTAISDLPPEQRAIRDKCFHPTGRFVEFKKEEIEQSIPDRFEQMVRKYPDRLAVKTRGCQFTYKELNKAANLVARAILAQRGEGEEPIALLLDHDAPMIVAILGVLKVGKIYVPLDVSYPMARLRYMMEDSEAALIVTNNKNFSLARDLSKDALQFINLDGIDSHISDENVGLSIAPGTDAYILYTSGSTGQPKGVVSNHRNILHGEMAYTNGLHICEEDRLTVLHSCSFGASVDNLFGGLLNGATLLPFDLKWEGVAQLANWLIQEEITIYHSAPTAFRHFLYELAGGESFPKLRVINLSGAAIYGRDVELYKKHFSPECIFLHMIGTRETGFLRWYFMDKAIRIHDSTVPVGYPFDDMEVLLLDDDGKQVGFNQIGEIAVKSCYLAVGYWRRPDLTEAKFLPDPNGGDERIYLTGDLGRMSEDGCFELVGRKDFQVKVRGYRVEIGEVEMRLRDHAAIKGAVVTVREAPSGDKRLVAYFVPTGNPGPNISEMRSFLKEKLPDYMIPSAFVMLDTMPRTPTGKVDRKALPPPGNARPELDNPFVAPRTPIEVELAKIWAEVLSLDEVGIHDNFFDLGGHSLLATQVISRVVNTFKVELPIMYLFESPTVADMAVVITKNMAKKAGDKELARMLAELESLSDEEAQRRLAEEGK